MSMRYYIIDDATSDRRCAFVCCVDRLSEVINNYPGYFLMNIKENAHGFKSRDDAVAFCRRYNNYDEYYTKYFAVVADDTAFPRSCFVCSAYEVERYLRMFSGYYRLTYDMTKEKADEYARKWQNYEIDYKPVYFVYVCTVPGADKHAFVIESRYSGYFDEDCIREIGFSTDEEGAIEICEQYNRENTKPIPCAYCSGCKHFVDFDWYFGTENDEGYIECNAETGKIETYDMSNDEECKCPYYEV